MANGKARNAKSVGNTPAGRQEIIQLA